MTSRYDAARALLFMLPALAGGGCTSPASRHDQSATPQAYIHYKADWVLGETFSLRIVDWGERTIPIAITQFGGARKIGVLSRDQFHSLTADLRALGILELKTFHELFPYTCPDFHFVEVTIDGKHNKFYAEAPYDFAEISPNWTWHGSKPHADLLKRLRRTEKDYPLRWEVETYAFEPGYKVADTGTDGVEDVYFTSDGDLQYATPEYREVSENHHVSESWAVWHSLDPKRPPTAVRAPEVDENTNLEEYTQPRPETSSLAVPRLPTIPGAKLHKLAQPRIYCNGRVALCARMDHGLAIVAYLLAQPSAHEFLFSPNTEDVNPLKIDVAPDGSRVAWVANERLMTSDDIKIDCDDLVERLESDATPDTMYPDPAGLNPED
jgi:hypothetical protein